LKRKLANIRASMRNVSSDSMEPPPQSLEVAGLFKANKLTVPPPLSLEVAGVSKANGSDARQRLSEGDLDAMPDLVIESVDSVAAEPKASSTDLQGLAFQELFAGAGV
jgi:hypothetical protein